MTRVYFVRHAQPDHSHGDDRTRPLTEEGKADSEKVFDFFKDKNIGAVYCSPYRRSIDTVRKTAAHFDLEIRLDERLRERESGAGGNNLEMFRKRWENHAYHEENGESISEVQKRNVEALRAILENNPGGSVVIGTHGTALSSIINYFDPEFGCDGFLRIIDRMPYILEMNFEGQRLVSMTERLHVEKQYKGADKKQQIPKPEVLK